MSEALQVPPLMWAEPAAGDPLTHAVDRATQGCDAGLIAYRLGPVLEAALVFAPEVPLAEAAVMLPLCGVGLQNALGALAPPELAVHLGWAGGIQVNGARCGQLQIIAPPGDAGAVPDWLVVGFALPLVPPGPETGETPDDTALYAEGCGDLDPTRLLESWARHVMMWLSRWEAEGPAPLYAEWRGLVPEIGQDVQIAGHSGHVLGVDEHFGLLLRDDQGGTGLVPLTTLLETRP